MSDDKRKVHEVFCEEFDYEILILELPSDILEDKLTYFAQEKGRVPKDFYDDFILAECVANINKILHKITQDSVDGKDKVDLEKLRSVIVGYVLKYNPLLNYENIIINKSKVLKVRNKDYKLIDGETRLADNKSWKEVITENPEKKDIVVQEDLENLQDISDIEFKVEKMWWKRIGRYVEIKKFTVENTSSLLQGRFFHNRTSFSTFIVTICVVDFEELFQLLDNMGVPARVAPPLLMHELYELCEDVNPNLTYDAAKDLTEESEDCDEDCDSCKPVKGNKKMTTGSNMGKYAKEPKQKKRFKDVPKEDLLNLTSAMKVSLIGQDKAVDSLVDAIQRASVGLKDPDKPIGTFIFAGTTGCGKSLASKVLADELIRDRNNLTIIDCSEYSADHEYSKLIGAPSGYVGYEQGGVLTNAVLKNPFSVVVFDEIEKASPKVFQLLLQVLDEGRLTDNKGTKVSFKDTVVIMTSNIGVKDISKIEKTIGFGDVNVVTKEKKTKAIEGALKKKFKPEFLNRIDEIIFFNDLKKQDYMRIIDIELYKLNDNLQTNDTEYKSLTLNFDDKVKDIIYKQGVNEEYGARPLKREIEQLISTPLAVKLLSGKVENDSIINISAYRNKIKFEDKARVLDPPFYMTKDETTKGKK